MLCGWKRSFFFSERCSWWLDSPTLGNLRTEEIDELFLKEETPTAIPIRSRAEFFFFKGLDI